MKETLGMSNQELHRHHIINQVLENQITQKKAADLLNITDRQVRNLLMKYELQGARGLISQKRGKPSNRTFDPKFKNQIMTLVREKYPDFGPTFAKEKLLEYHNLNLSVETLRKWMIQEKLWIHRKSKHRVHPLRPRRDYFGELIQIDASHHHWFEDRGDKCALIVFIDDATSTLTSMFFCAVECLEGYFQALKKHVLKYGRPGGLYSDRHVIFAGWDKIQHAQFIRALKELDIESVLASSPQAKGRVERVNQTLQDRLVKEMRLRNISNIDDANRYLPEFIEKFNKKFSKEPRGQFDAHRPLESDSDLERTLTRCEVRTVTKDLSISYHNKFYKILESGKSRNLSRRKVEVRQKTDGTIKIYHENEELRYVPIEIYADEHKVLNGKEKLVWMPGRGNHPQTMNHPWKKYGHQLCSSCKKLSNREAVV